MPRLPAVVERKLRRPYVDYALCLLFKRRRIRLPVVDPALLWPGFDEAPVTLGVLPKGDWSAPMTDFVVLMKIAAVTAPRRILELGSYRGYTAAGLLDHTPEGTTLVAVDIDPQHGEAYAGRSIASRVDRRVGAIDLDRFTRDEVGSFDLVFVDADHRHDAVVHDTDVALQMVAPGGMVVWHDYSNWGWFTGDCGVPEVLNDLGERLALAHLQGSNMVVHLPAWGDDHATVADLADATASDVRAGHWHSTTARRFGF